MCLLDYSGPYIITDSDFLRIINYKKSYFLRGFILENPIVTFFKREKINKERPQIKFKLKKFF